MLESGRVAIVRFLEAIGITTVILRQWRHLVG